MSVNSHILYIIYIFTSDYPININPTELFDLTGLSTQVAGARLSHYSLDGDI